MGDNLAASVLPSPDGQLLAVSHWGEGPGAYQKTIHLYDVVAGKVKRLESESVTAALAFAPDGRTLAAWEGTRTVVLWDVAEGKVMRRFEVDKDLMGFEPGHGVFSPDGKSLALQLSRAERVGRTIGISVSHYLSSWDVTTGKQRWSVQDPRGDLVFSPDGNTLAQGGSGTIHLWDSATGNKQKTLEYERTEIVAGSGPNRLAFTPDGKMLIASKGAQVYLWDLDAGKQLRKLVGHRGWISAIRVSPDGNLLATASDDTTVLLWDLSRK